MEPPSHAVHARPEAWTVPVTRKVAAAVTRPIGVLFVLAAILQHAAGGDRFVDDRVWAAIHHTMPAPSLAQAPTVIAVDDATVAMLGPPPWDADTWRRVGEALGRRGIRSVLLADPWPRMVREPRAGAEVGTRVVVPGRTAADGPLLRLPDDHAPWLAPSPMDVRLGRGSLLHAAVPRDVDGPWWPCAAASGCEGVAAGDLVPFAGAPVPMVSVVTLLAVDEGALQVGAPGAVLGITSSAFADAVEVGIDGQRVSPVEALARAAHGAQRGPTMPSGAVVGGLWLIAVYVATALALQAPRRRVAIAVPVAAAACVLVAELFGGVRAPLLGTLAVGIAAPVAELLATGRASIAGVRRLGLLVVRGASRAGLLRRRIADVQSLTEALADLTRSHADGVPFAVWLLPPGQHRLRHAGDVGLPSTRVRDEAYRLDHADVAAAREAWRGVSSTTLLRDGGEARLVPLRQAGQLVGFWVLATPEGAAGPDPRRLSTLATWVGERLALPGLRGTLEAGEDVVPGDVDDDALENLFRAADEERRRWQRSVQALGLPVLVADVAGVVGAMNPAMEGALADADLPRVRSLREITWRLVGDDGLDRSMRALFIEGRPLSMPWVGGDGTLRVRPVAVGVGAEDASLLGYIAWVEPRGASPGAREEEGRTLRLHVNRGARG